MIGCDTKNIDGDKHSKCNIDIATVSQSLDAMSKFNLIHSKTQVCIIFL